MLRKARWVIGEPSGAAAKLGVPRTTLIHKMQKLGIRRDLERELPLVTKTIGEVVQNLNPIVTAFRTNDRKGADGRRRHPLDLGLMRRALTAPVPPALPGVPVCAAQHDLAAASVPAHRLRVSGIRAIGWASAVPTLEFDHSHVPDKLPAARELLESRRSRDRNPEPTKSP